ncbi:kinase-like protein [Microthyrium microscopicum]|uniref:Kinase-like protein n=1 Tax=Microthyrium microscopicum TaxID=703497 RepID=A0A6A6U4K2_9PEZI|nr:kinase-like protein [Microthyrium microscopicum]
MATSNEGSEDDLSGGCYPIHIKDILNNQYQITRKLGDGGSSTVWLALDIKFRRHVAVKIIVASKADRAADEIAMYEHLCQSVPSAYSVYVTELLDSFQLQRPDGIYHCLVLEAMGPDVDDMLEYHPSLVSAASTHYPIWMVKSILKQVLQSLAFLHKHGIVHGDVQPGNVLFSVPSFPNCATEELEQFANDSKDISPSVPKVDDNTDENHVAEARSLGEYVSLEPGFTVKLADIGSAFLMNNPPKKAYTPLDLRSPELILKNQLDEKLDIWSFGCLFFEIMTGKALFSPPLVGAEAEHRDNEHLWQMHDRLGFFSRDMVLGEMKHISGGDDVPSAMSLESKFNSLKPMDCSETEASRITNLMRRILQYDPTKRPTASEILGDVWFAGE